MASSSDAADPEISIGIGLGRGGGVIDRDECADDRRIGDGRDSSGDLPNRLSRKTSRGDCNREHTDQE
jgi:hypothetical protein